jgi:hypothetical protein
VGIYDKYSRNRSCPSEPKEMSISAFLTADQRAQLFGRVISQVMGFLQEFDYPIFTQDFGTVELTSIGLKPILLG